MTGLRLEIEGGIGFIRLNRPREHNALTFEIVDRIAGQIQQWEDSGQVSGVIVAGEGGKAFAAGADIRELLAKRVEDMVGPGMQHAMARIRNSTLPSVAAVDGVAFGGGFELALACDIRIATPRSRFGLPEVGLGVIPGAGGTQLLSRYAGISVANYHILTGKPMDAERAYQLGLVSELHEPDRLEPAAVELVHQISSKGPLSRRLAKRVIQASAESSMTSGLELELFAQAALFGTPDRAEGLQAFLERRPPSFPHASQQPSTLN